MLDRILHLNNASTNAIKQDQEFVTQLNMEEIIFNTTADSGLAHANLNMDMMELFIIERRRLKELQLQMVAIHSLESCLRQKLIVIGNFTQVLPIPSEKLMCHLTDLQQVSPGTTLLSTQKDSEILSAKEVMVSIMLNFQRLRRFVTGRIIHPQEWSFKRKVLL